MVALPLPTSPAQRLVKQPVAEVFLMFGELKNCLYFLFIINKLPTLLSKFDNMQPWN